jgi:hypothetical protein
LPTPPRPVIACGWVMAPRPEAERALRSSSSSRLRPRKGGFLPQDLVLRRARKERLLGRLAPEPADALQQLLLRLRLLAADQVLVDDLRQQALGLAGTHADRDQPVVHARGVSGEGGNPFRGGEARGEVVGREDGDGVARLLDRPIHLEDEVALEIPVLEDGRVAGLLERPGDPGRPVAVGPGEADEEVALAVRGVSHPGCRWYIVAARRRRHLTTADISTLAVGCRGARRQGPPVRPARGNFPVSDY